MESKYNIVIIQQTTNVFVNDKKVEFSDVVEETVQRKVKESKSNKVSWVRLLQCVSTLFGLIDNSMWLFDTIFLG